MLISRTLTTRMSSAARTAATAPAVGRTRAVICVLVSAALMLSLVSMTPARGSDRDDQPGQADAKPRNTPAQRQKIAEARRQRPEPPPRCAYVPSEFPAARETRACLRYAGKGRTVLVIGDSHAEHWVPALRRVAERRDWRLYSLTRAKCNPLNFIAVRPLDRGHPTVGEACTNWKRRGAYSTVIERVDPDLVLFGGRSQVYDIRFQVGGPVIRRSSPRYFKAWKRSWIGTVKTMTKGDHKVGALTLQPTLRFNTPDCLARHGFSTRACDLRVTRDAATRRANQWISRINHVYRQVRPVPVNALVCPGLRCTAVQDGLVTHADLSHLTTVWSRSVGIRVFAMLLNRGLV